MKNRASVLWLSKGTVVDSTDLNTTEVLLELGALDSVDYFADGETRCVVATEDTDKEALRALLASNGFVENDLEVASYTGCSKIEAATVLGGFLQDKAPHVSLIVHRDRDYMNDDNAQKFESRLNAVNIKSLLTDSNDIECDFINAAHLNALNPTIAVERIQELIEAATAETADKSIAAIVNQRTAEAFRARSAGGPTPDHGAIAVQANTDFHSDPQKYRRGKVALGRLQALLQQELGSNPRVFFPSDHLQSPKLTALSAAVWPG
ncbi:hypothetical protein [Tardiphaga sp. vice278]|uniref:hypothetical protein n=1 Tax=Tardiphaga sp. vice278 TaxID=2592815 RepID=UPI001162D27E|nr:hypothetical protein [Tardiphaga sp. vice278]QDM17557.1 hypothetical protein FNL53_17615 [Tardiphaga sp. vice278]